jgi:hypothetical protein
MLPVFPSISDRKTIASNYNYPGAQLHMLIIIPVKFHDLMSNIFMLLATQVENCKILLSKGQYLRQNKNKSTGETLGAQLRMLINIPVKFHDSRSTTF